MPIDKEKMREYQRLRRWKQTTSYALSLLSDLDAIDEAKRQGLPTWMLSHVVIPVGR